MDDVGARRLAAAIISQAANDMESVYEKTMCLHNKCFKDGVCDRRKLVDYLVKSKRKGRALPFENQDDYTAVDFFKENNAWGRLMLDISDIDELPKKVKDMVAMLDDTGRRCAGCIKKYEKIATKRIKTEEFENGC